MFSLNTLPTVVKRRKRIGRGGKLGGTSTRGFGGQKARTGDTNVRVGFEGGQMPLFRRLPKRGFNNADFKKVYYTVNLNQLEASFDKGTAVTVEALIEKGIIKPRKNRPVLVKILGSGSLTKSLTITADAFSEGARQAIQAQGGQANLNKENEGRGITE